MQVQPGKLLSDTGEALARVFGADDAIAVGLSAGPHSSGLLAALAARRGEGGGVQPFRTLRAVHVDHGMQPSATAWAERAAAIAAQLDVEFSVLKVQVVADGSGPEAAARAARYAALAADLAAGECLVTGHHRDDQAETVMLPLLRGAGAPGRRGMAARRAVGAGWLVRPGLELSAATLAACARDAELDVVDDPSNADVALARGWFRERVAPALNERYPRWTGATARASAAVGDAVSVADEVAAADLAALREATSDASFDVRGACSVSGLLSLPPARRRLAVRAWLTGAGCAAPSAAFQQRLLDECLLARTDGAAALAVAGNATRTGTAAAAWLRRDRGRLFLLSAEHVARLAAAAVAGKPRSDGDEKGWQQDWQPPVPLDLPYGRVLCVGPAGRPGAEPGVPPGRRASEMKVHTPAVPVCAQALAEGDWSVRLRAGGEFFRPRGRRRRSLRKWLSDSALPPWERGLLPLLYRDGELVAVPGVGAVADLSPQWMDGDAGGGRQWGDVVSVAWDRQARGAPAGA